MRRSEDAIPGAITAPAAETTVEYYKVGANGLPRSQRPVRTAPFEGRTALALSFAFTCFLGDAASLSV